MEYKDFVLQLDRAPGGQGFVSRVIQSPAGEAEAPFVSPVAPEELNRLWQTALEVRYRGVRDFRPPAAPSSMSPLTAELSLEELGNRLFQALFAGPVRTCWARSTALYPDGVLRLKLQLNLVDPALAPLADLPWEYLFSLEQGGFIGLRRSTPILRHLRLPLQMAEPPVAQPLRVLVVSAQHRSMPWLTLQEEGERIATALTGLPGVETLPLHNPAIEDLRNALLTKDFHILHFMGHGGFDAASGQGVLYFTGRNGELLAISGGLLATHLAGFPFLRLVFLNACETARANSRAPFAGVAAALLKAGLPAVIAMQRPVQDKAALEFSRTVYHRLASGDPIDAAVTEGRLAITRDRGALLDWGTPVLFLRTEALFAEKPTVLEKNIQFAEPKQKPKQRNLYPALLAGILAAGLGIAGMLEPWKFLQGAEPTTTPYTSTEALVTNDKPLTTDSLPHPEVEPAPPRRQREIEAGQRSTQQQDKEILTEPAQTEPVPEPPKPKPEPPSSYELSEGTPVHIPGLDAEVSAQFFERNGFSFARFSVGPSGQGMLQQPPVMGPGPLEFPASNGTYHLDVLSLNLAERRARVRLRLDS